MGGGGLKDYRVLPFTPEVLHSSFLSLIFTMLCPTPGLSCSCLWNVLPPHFTQLILMLQGLHQPTPPQSSMISWLDQTLIMLSVLSCPCHRIVWFICISPSDCTLLKVGCQYWVPGGRPYLVNEPAVLSESSWMIQKAVQEPVGPQGHHEKP